jgi:hypothetical protein
MQDAAGDTGGEGTTGHHMGATSGFGFTQQHHAAHDDT